MSTENDIRPHGEIVITDRRGYAYLPDSVKDELGIPKGEKPTIPYFLDANCVLLIRKDAKIEDIIKGLEILKQDLKLRKK